MAIHNNFKLSFLSPLFKLILLIILLFYYSHFISDLSLSGISALIAASDELITFSFILGSKMDLSIVPEESLSFLRLLFIHPIQVVSY